MKHKTWVIMAVKMSVLVFGVVTSWTCRHMQAFRKNILPPSPMSRKLHFISGRIMTSHRRYPESITANSRLRFTVDELAIQQVFVRVLQFFFPLQIIIPTLFHTHLPPPPRGVR
jgi:hypothetical protein